MKITKHHLNVILGKPDSASQKFHDKTKIKKLYKELPLDQWPKSWQTVYFKTYPRFDQIILPPFENLHTVSLEEVLMKRKSERVFSSTGVSLEQLSTFLHYSVGLRNAETTQQAGNRFYPSPGGRYATETYIISLNSDLQTGVYHYNLQQHSLETMVVLPSFNHELYFAHQPWDWIANTSFLVVLTGSFYRNTMKYRDRGYRHVMTEAGHIGQNIYLVSTAMHLHCCGIGGYLDDKLNELLGVDGVSETVINVTGIGNKPE